MEEQMMKYFEDEMSEEEVEQQEFEESMELVADMGEAERHNADKDHEEYLAANVYEAA